MTKFTYNHIKHLKEKGLIRSHKGVSKSKRKAFDQKSKGKDWINEHLSAWCLLKNYDLRKEYRFHPTRKWRFDWCIPAIMVAIEFEGGIHDRNGSHTRLSNLQRDVLKYNEAQLYGWTVLRYTSINYKSAIKDIERLASPYTVPCSDEKQRVRIIPNREERAEVIVTTILNRYRLSKSDMLSKSRKRHLVIVRQFICYFLRMKLGMQLSDIAQYIGGKDHSTVIHSIRTIEALIQFDDEAKSEMQALKELL